MKEIPIIYQTEMIRALLAGRKTNTRRLKGLHKINENPDDWEYYGHEMSGLRVKYYLFYNLLTGEYVKIKPQFGQKDDLLYVREAHAYIEDTSYDDYSSLGGWAYKADWKGDDEQKWKPSIHMPKRASRIWLRNTADPIPQRLQDISEADAIAEGIVALSKDGRKYKYGLPEIDGLPGPNGGWEWSEWQPTATLAFKKLICSIHGPEIWDRNPYVWKIQFEVLSTTGKPELKKEVSNARI